MTRIYTLLARALSAAPGYVKASNSGLSYVDKPLPAPGKIDDLVIFMPGSDIAIQSVPLPARTIAEARRAAAFAVEDDLAEPAEDIHVALGPKQSGKSVREVHVCKASLMQDWVDALDASGLGASTLVAETSVLADVPTAIDLGDRILMSGEGTRYALDASLPDEALRAFARLAPSELTVVGKDLANRFGEASVAATVDQNPLIQLAAQAESFPSLINLRQGPFSDRKAFKIDLTDWRIPLGLAATAAIAWIGAASVETWSHNRSSAYMEGEALRLYQAYFPAEQAPARPAAAVSAKLSDQPAAELPLLPVAAALYEAVADVPDASITSFRYDAGTGRLNIGLSYGSYGDDLLMKAALEARSLSVNLGSSRANGGNVSGDMTVELQP